jgi:DNA-binding response OmpR family regulator
MVSVEQWCAAGGESKRSSLRVPPGGKENVGKTEPRILIIEDDFFVATHLEAVLNGLNFRSCDIVSRPDSAVAHAADFPPDLLLADVNLEADIDGIETARRIAKGSAVTVIFVTAYADGDTANRIRAAFPTAPILQKPVSPEQLRAAIDLALRPSS